MKQSKNILTDTEKELVNLLMQDCQSTDDIHTKLKRLSPEQSSKFSKPRWTNTWVMKSIPS